MDKKKYELFKRVSLSLIILAMILSKSYEYFHDSNIEDSIVFYDVPDKTQTMLIDKEIKEENRIEEISSLININTATSDELQKLYRIGPALAQRIIDYRNTYGSFVSIEEIKEVKGIGEKTYEKIKDFITIQ